MCAPDGRGHVQLIVFRLCDEGLSSSLARGDRPPGRTTTPAASSAFVRALQRQPGQDHSG